MQKLPYLFYPELSPREDVINQTLFDNISNSKYFLITISVFILVLSLLVYVYKNKYKKVSGIGALSVLILFTIVTPNIFNVLASDGAGDPLVQTTPVTPETLINSLVMSSSDDSTVSLKTYYGSYDPLQKTELIDTGTYTHSNVWAKSWWWDCGNWFDRTKGAMSVLVTFNLNDKNIGSATLRYDGEGTTSYWTDKIGRYFYDSSLSPGDNILKSSFDYYQTGTSPDGFIDARHDFTIKHPSRPAVNGVCGEKAYVCNSGEANSRTEDISKYAWSCVGSDGGSSSACVETKPPVVNIYFSDANNQALDGAPSDNN